jgi:hypothetical protein
MDRHHHILTFIATIRNSFDKAIEVYTQGGCFHFYLILACIYRDAVPYYNGHVITKIQDKYYDITGEVQREHHFNLYDDEKALKRVMKLRYKG